MRSNVARKLERIETVEPEAAYQAVGRVVRAAGTAFVVAAGAAEIEACRAVSCMVEPVAGDEVLVSVLPERRAYILAVLEREGRDVSVVLEGDLHVKLPRGRFVVGAAEGVTLASGKEVGVVAGELKVNARLGSVLVESLSYLGTAVQAEIEKAKVKAAALDASVERVTQRLKRVYRFVEEFEQLRAERVDYVAKKNMSLRGENTLVTAEELVKLDGAQIHLG
ncbi:MULTISPECIES: DUF3540 domain-containing protein [Sorangium]|uniref:DUF3540 domain-containing protein n=1 Tax=Sorangium cellulosum TaxID=56 RepID=A0A4P2QLY5_SORCE|nr:MULTISPECIES: DUF3540 domain-containing protein [Sorangium]AUX31077.1 hypothetical protein SOCE836_031940 [Sorangium cellulosum]WCQ90457.1 hypothetical protein NQZ70_03161 [Sorangium sp. Soce836]